MNRHRTRQSAPPRIDQNLRDAIDRLEDNTEELGAGMRTVKRDMTILIDGVRACLDNETKTNTRMRILNTRVGRLEESVQESIRTQRIHFGTLQDNNRDLVGKVDQIVKAVDKLLQAGQPGPVQDENLLDDL